MEAALVFLQRKEFYLSQTESSEILPFLDSMKIERKKAEARDGCSFFSFEAKPQSNFQCRNISNLDLSRHSSLTVGISE